MENETLLQGYFCEYLSEHPDRNYSKWSKRSLTNVSESSSQSSLGSKENHPIRNVFSSPSWSSEAHNNDFRGKYRPRSTSRSSWSSSPCRTYSRDQKRKPWQKPRRHIYRSQSSNLSASNSSRCPLRSRYRKVYRGHHSNKMKNKSPSIAHQNKRYSKHTKAKSISPFAEEKKECSPKEISVYYCRKCRLEQIYPQRKLYSSSYESDSENKRQYQNVPRCIPEVELIHQSRYQSRYEEESDNSCPIISQRLYRSQSLLSGGTTTKSRTSRSISRSTRSRSSPSSSVYSCSQSSVSFSSASVRSESPTSCYWSRSRTPSPYERNYQSEFSSSSESFSRRYFGNLPNPNDLKSGYWLANNFDSPSSIISSNSANNAFDSYISPSQSSLNSGRELDRHRNSSDLLALPHFRTTTNVLNKALARNRSSLSTEENSESNQSWITSVLSLWLPSQLVNLVDRLKQSIMANLPNYNETANTTPCIRHPNTMSEGSYCNQHSYISSTLPPLPRVKKYERQRHQAYFIDRESEYIKNKQRQTVSKIY